jgi:hypothetical protein
MIRQKRSPKDEVIAFHRASETNAPTFAYLLIKANIIDSSIEELQRIYDELVEAGEMEPARGEAELRDRGTEKLLSYVRLYRLRK